MRHHDQWNEPCGEAGGKDPGASQEARAHVLADDLVPNLGPRSGKEAGRQPAGQRAGHSRADHDQRKRHVEEEDRGERGDGHADQQRAAQRAGADADERRGDDAHDGRLEPVEHPADGRDVAVGGVGPGQRQHQNEGGRDEGDPGHQTALHLVQQPSDIDRELLGLGTGQQHAVVERVQEPRLVDPAAPVDQLLVHQRDLSGGTAEVDEPELDPERCRATKGNARRRGTRLIGWCAHSTGSASSRLGSRSGSGIRRNHTKTATS